MQNQGSLAWFLYLCALEGAAALAALLLIPSEGGTLSMARLALVGILAAAILTFLYVARQTPGIHKRFVRPAFILLTGGLALAFGALLFLLRYWDPEGLRLTYERLSPLLWYFLLISVQGFVLLLHLGRGFDRAKLAEYSGVHRASFAFLVLLTIGLILVAVTGLGITPDPAYWGEPGVPILGWQFAAALLLGMGVFALTLIASPRLLELALPLGIYLLAVLLWFSVPVDVQANSFYMPIGPPAFEAYPYSDAAYYDQMAHSVLIGHPYLGEIPTRPLYIFVLTIFHLFFGENYAAIINAQTLLLAAIPVTLYFIGRRLHSHTAGLLAALFFIFRELTTLMVASDTRVSSTKTLLVDLPTLLLLLLACLFALRWFESRGQRDALVAGGMFGLLLLLRTQSMLVLPFILLLALLVFGWKGRALYVLVSIFLLGLVITLAPWLVHNYLQSGVLTFDAPFQYKIIASQYAYSGNLDIQNYDFEGKGLGRVLLDFVLADPGFVFGFISNHFLAAQIGGLLALPLIKTYNGIFEPLNLYWMQWDGSLEWYNALLLILYLAIIALGLGAVWRRWRWMGLLPLAFSFGYALATAVGRFSGWRYNLPADWVWYFYFALGCAELLRQAAGALGFTRLTAPVVTHSAEGLNLRSAALIAGVFVLISASPWLVRSVAAPRYAEQSLPALEDRITSIPDAPPADALRSFAAQPDTYVGSGRLLYPRAFSRDNGIASTNPWPAYAIRDYPRLGFLLLNQTSTNMLFPGRTSLLRFPHGADAIVLGCRRADFVEVRLIAFPDLDIVHTSAPLTEPCQP